MNEVPSLLFGRRERGMRPKMEDKMFVDCEKHRLLFLERACPYFSGRKGGEAKKVKTKGILKIIIYYL